MEDFYYLRDLIENSLKTNGYRFYKTISLTIYNKILFFQEYNFELNDFLNKYETFDTIRKKLIEISGIGLLTISFKNVNDFELISIEISPSDELVFHENKVFFLRNGPQTISLEGPKLAKYVIKRFGVKETQLSLLNISQQVPGLDERIGLLKKFIKNLMIVYYSEGISKGVHDPNINTIIYKISKIINNLDNSTLSDYI